MAGMRMRLSRIDADFAWLIERLQRKRKRDREGRSAVKDAIGGESNE